jgi:hypothetical protein
LTSSSPQFIECIVFTPRHYEISGLHEMSWTINFLVHKAETWCAQMSQNGTPIDDGLRCYTIRQAQMYRQLAKDARSKFIIVNLTLGHHNL